MNIFQRIFSMPTPSVKKGDLFAIWGKQGSDFGIYKIDTIRSESEFFHYSIRKTDVEAIIKNKSYPIHRVKSIKSMKELKSGDTVVFQNGKEYVYHGETRLWLDVFNTCKEGLYKIISL